MRILGIDYGTKRIGLALSDESHLIAGEFKILSPKDFFEQIEEVVKDQDVGEIVIGLPLNMSGQDSEKTVEARAFGEKLEHLLNLPVHLMDERLSSSMAQTISGSDTSLDSLAAQIILQNYLDKNRV
jgi:putative Holliday junction resolvase